MLYSSIVVDWRLDIDPNRACTTHRNTRSKSQSRVYLNDLTVFYTLLPGIVITNNSHLDIVLSAFPKGSTSCLRILQPVLAMTRDD